MSIESQIDRLVQYRHYRIPDIQWSTVSYPEGSPEGFFIDRGVSAYQGSILAKRPAGAALLNSLQSGDHLLVWSVDRLFRNIGDFGATLDLFKKRGITVHFVRDGIDLTTSAGQLKADILAVLAQHWSRMISFRVREANRIKALRRGNSSFVESKPIKAAPAARKVVEDYLEATTVDSVIALTTRQKAKVEMPRGNRVWGYIRVSHSGQVESGLGLEYQRWRVEQCMDAMVQDGAERMEVVSDEAISSFKVPFANRPGGKKILSEAKAGDVVVVYRFDRIFRSLQDLVNQVAEFRERGIALRLIEEDIQTNDSVSDWYLSLLGIFAELESKIKGERVSEAIQRQKRLGFRYSGKSMLCKPININGQKRWKLDVQMLVRLRISHILNIEHKFSNHHSCHIANAIATDYGHPWVDFVFHTKKGARARAAVPDRHAHTLAKWNQIAESIGAYAIQRIEQKARQKLAAGISECALLFCKRAGVPVERLRKVLVVRPNAVSGLPLADAKVSLPGIEDL